MMALLMSHLMSHPILASAVSAVQKKKPAAASSAKKKSAAKSKKKTSRPPVARQTVPDGARSKEIQEALQRAGYLDSAPSGKWDAATSAALTRYQKDQGFNPTGKPDAHSLIKLGLGPKHENQYQPPAPN